MSTAGRIYGIQTLQDLKDRCRLNEETGCWVWAMAVTTAGVPSCSVPVGVLGNLKRLIMPPYKAAWALSGRSLPPAGQVLMRRKCCREPLCILPDHRKKGTRSQINQTAAARGSYASEAREAVLWKARQKQAIPLDMVRRCEALLGEGASCASAARILGIGDDTVAKIRDGEHIHQRRPKAGVSVFTLRTDIRISEPVEKVDYGDRHGENNSHVHITDEQVDEIVARFARGERAADIAEDFGIRREHCWRLATGRVRGAYVPPPPHQPVALGWKAPSASLQVHEPEPA